MPLLRSRIQADILTVILLNPEQEWTVTDLASRVGTSVATAQREVVRAERAGVVSSRKLGNVRLATAAAGPLTGPLTELLLRAFGPPQVVAEELAGVGAIQAAYLFGSWAARYTGQPGHAPADIDVLVIGKPDRDDLDDAAQRATRRLAREVNATVRSPDWWHQGTDAFHTEITTRPLVPLGADAAETATPTGSVAPEARCVGSGGGEHDPVEGVGGDGGGGAGQQAPEGVGAVAGQVHLVGDLSEGGLDPVAPLGDHRQQAR